MSDVATLAPQQSTEAGQGRRVSAPRLIAFGLLRFLLRVPSTLVHESAHAFAALVTGGLPTGLRVYSDTTAHVNSIHLTILSRLATLASGYLAPPLLGLALIFAGLLDADRSWTGGIYAFVAAIGIFCVVLSRNLLALMGSMYLVGLGYVLMQTMWVPPEFFGAALVVMGALDSIGLLRLHLEHGWAVESDATSLSWRIFHPAILATVWVMASVGSVAVAAWAFAVLL